MKLHDAEPRNMQADSSGGVWLFVFGFGFFVFVLPVIIGLAGG
jgi:hypothetical protein